MLTNNVVSFEQPGPEVQSAKEQSICKMCRRVWVDLRLLVQLAIYYVLLRYIRGHISSPVISNHWYLKVNFLQPKNLL